MPRLPRSSRCAVSTSIPIQRRRLDRARVRAAYQSANADVTRVSPPWRRYGRRFVQIRMTVPDVRRLHEVGPLSWSTYRFDEENGHHVFEQKVGASALRPGTLGKVGWNGSEIVAFRLHLPSRILWHNARDLDTGQPRGAARGNILAWEQQLADRLDGTPIDIKVEMDSQSILTGRCGCSGARSWRRSACWRCSSGSPSGRAPTPPLRRRAPDRRSYSVRVSASVRRSFLTDSSPRPLASERASIRSTLLLTTPASVTCPPSTIT